MKRKRGGAGAEVRAGGDQKGVNEASATRNVAVRGGVRVGRGSIGETRARATEAAQSSRQSVSSRVSSSEGGGVDGSESEAAEDDDDEDEGHEVDALSDAQSRGQQHGQQQQDPSARTKRAQRIVARALDGASSEDELGRDATELEAHMWNEDDDDDNDNDDDDAEAALIQSADEEEGARDDENGKGADAASTAAGVPETPSKRKRGRPRKDRTKEETPPGIDMPPYERYFWDNRTGAGKTSNNVFAPGTMLDHDRFFEQRNQYQDGHQAEREFLLRLHESAFDQWLFELENGFNLCLYGYGSKRSLIKRLAQYVEETSRTMKATIVIVNGYSPNLWILDILTTIASTMFPASLKLPSTAAALLPLILETLSKNQATQVMYLLVNSADAPPLRRAATQSILATLAAHPSLRLVVSVDSPNFPLLWDAPLRSRFRFLFHDCTTFAPLDAEVVDAVDSVATLLGKKNSRIGGKDGVTFVLRSLPENARHLFRILVAEQVTAGIEADDGAATTTNTGVEYRVLYHKAREELVCSTEHQLRTLLKEFYDHQMVESRRDALGTERLLVPFRQEELESLLEDLVE